MSLQIKALLVCLVVVGVSEASEKNDATGDSEVNAEQTENLLPSDAKGPAILAPRLIKEEPTDERFESLVGETILMLTIDQGGRVTDAQIHQTSGNPNFDVAATEHVRSYLFEPARQNEQAIPVQILFRFSVALPVTSEAKKSPEDSREGGGLTGFVYLKGKGTPLAGVQVRLSSVDREVFSDADGAFAFEDLAPDSYRVTIEEDGFFTYRDQQQINPNEITEVKYFIEPESPDSGVLTVRAKRPQKVVSRRTVQVQEVAKIPGVNGDVVKVVQNLPGVARIPFGGGGLIIRGSNPGDSGAVINGHFVPLIFHFGGIRSVLPSEMIERLDFYPGNYSVRYGRFGGGIVDLSIKSPEPQWAARAEADVFDAGFYLTGPIADHTTLTVAGRRSYIDLLLPLALPDDANLELTVAPRYYDYQLLLDHRKPGLHVQLFVFGSDDALDFVLDEPINADPALRGDFENSTQFLRVYGKLRHRLTPSMDHEVSVSIGPNRLFAQLGTNLKFDNRAFVVTARDQLEWAASDMQTLSAGLDFETYQASLNIRAPFPPKEGEDRGQRLSSRDLITAERETEIWNLAGWLEHDLKLFDNRFLLTSGLRYDYDRRLGKGTWDPRWSVRYGLQSKKLTVKGGVGWFTQRPSPDESDPSFGNPDIDAERSIHYSAGMEWRLGEFVELDFVGFYKDLYHLIGSPPVSQQEAVSPTDVGRPLTNDGEGRSYGAELLLRHEPSSHFFGWLSYTIMRSERLDLDTGKYRVFDFDQTHIFTLLGQYKFDSRWEIGARFRWVTGLPQTPFVGRVYNSDEDVYEPILGEKNSKRLPSFQQLDLRIDRNWRFDTWTFSSYLEVQNVYNYKNVEGYRYDYDFRNKRPVTGLPVIPSLGLRGQF